jgi:methanogenesis imperfect marker protein 11
MEKISDPYIIKYPKIVAIADERSSFVELVETFDCVGGAEWSRKHYSKSPIVLSVRSVANTMRYLIRPGHEDLLLEGSRFPAGISGLAVEKDEIRVNYIGIGGGGVGAAACRSFAGGVIRCENDPSGGGKRAGSTIWLPKRTRVLIGVDDTDTPEEGATWTLTHNIAKEVEDDASRYLSHTIVQLFPVPYRTKNCVSVVCEFASTDPDALIQRFSTLLSEYTLSAETGMAAFVGFDPGELIDFGRRVKSGEVRSSDLPGQLKGGKLIPVMKGRGLIGAVAAIPFYTRFEEALELCAGPS